MYRFIHFIKTFIENRFNLQEDKAEEGEIIDKIKKDVSFKGANLWTLIFAIAIASIGLKDSNSLPGLSFEYLLIR